MANKTACFIIGIAGMVAVGVTVLNAYPPVAPWEWIAERLTAEKVIKLAIEVLALLPLALLVELTVTGWQGSSLHRLLVERRASVKVDWLLYAINELRLPHLLVLPLSAFGFSAAALVGNGVLAQHLGLAPWTTVDDPLLGFVLGWVLRDFTFYWVHRLLHSRVWWPLHRLHHSAKEMTVVCSGRSNFIADLGLNLLLATPLSLLTLPQESILATQLVIIFHGYLTHSNWLSGWGWFGRWVLVSPLHHRLHHGLRPEEYSRNMATMPIWDHLFGTFTQPDPKPVAIGVQHPCYETVRGSFAMLLPELGETARLMVGKPVDDPSVPG
ncbi:MAG: sterol desaturase family protein [Bacteroidota bacterium]